MASDDEAPDPGARTPQRGYVRFSATVARAVCRRVAAGETQAEICADPAMPSQVSLYRWAKQRAGFARAFARARALGGRGVNGRMPSFCPVAAQEIVARVSEGEMLSSITADAHLPSLSTVYRWRAGQLEFAKELSLAREALAERFSDLGWKLAMEATPETAYLTLVRLKQLRWMAAVFGPRTYGRLKPTEPPQPPPVTTVRYRHFDIEVDTVTGRRRLDARPGHHEAGPRSRGTVDGPGRPGSEGGRHPDADQGARGARGPGGAAAGRSGGVVLGGRLSGPRARPLASRYRSPGWKPGPHDRA